MLPVDPDPDKIYTENEIIAPSLRKFYNMTNHKKLLDKD